MGTLESLETKIAGIFKDVPQLPNSSKEGLAQVWPWLALIGGVLQLWAAWALYHLANFTNRLLDIAYYNSGNTYGPSSFDKTIIYLGAIMLAVDAVILLMAFPKLQKREKGGWNLLFLAALINLAYGVVQIFTYNRGFGAFLGSLIGSAIAFYLLFQVREKFGGPAVSKRADGPTKPTGSK